MTATSRMAGHKPDRLMGCLLAASLPEAKRRSDAALGNSNLAGSDEIRQVLAE